MSTSVPGSFIDIDGISTYWVEAGSGGTVVFIHGWSLDLTYWQPEIEFVAAEHHAVAYDWRGMGRSGGDDSVYDFPRLAEDLAELLTKLALDRPVLCGHSEGGVIALQFAVAYPGRLSGLVLADTPGPHNHNTGPLSYFVTKFAIDLFDKIPCINPLRPLVPIFRDQLYSSGFRSSHPDAIKAWERQYLSNSVDAILNSDRALALRSDITRQVREIRAPTLLLRGSQDALVPMGDTEAYHEQIQGSEMHLIEDSGHMTLQEQPGQFNERLGAFLAANNLP